MYPQDNQSPRSCGIELVSLSRKKTRGFLGPGQTILWAHQELRLPRLDRQDGHAAGFLGAKDETAALDVNVKEEVLTNQSQRNSELD